MSACGFSNDVRMMSLEVVDSEGMNLDAECGRLLPTAKLPRFSVFAKTRREDDETKRETAHAR